MTETLDGAEALTALTHFPVAVVVMDGPRIRWVNAALSKLFHSSADELVGLTAQQAADTRFAPLFDGSPRLQVCGADGAARWFDRGHLPIAGSSLSLEYFEEVTARVALDDECRRLRARLEALETKDPVTGLLSRKAIMQALETQVSRSRRYQNPLAVLLLTLESPAEPGDMQETLRGIGQALNDQLRWADQLGMLQQNAFLIILPETSLSAANDLAEQLLGSRIRFPKTTADLAMTLGVAAWAKGDDPKKLLQRLQDARRPIAMQATS